MLTIVLNGICFELNRTNSPTVSMMQISYLRAHLIPSSEIKRSAGMNRSTLHFYRLGLNSVQKLCTGWGYSSVADILWPVTSAIVRGKTELSLQVVPI